MGMARICQKLASQYEPDWDLTADLMTTDTKFFL